MKKIILLVVILPLFISCSKEVTNLLSSSMSAKIDQTDWKAVAPAAVLNSGKFVITGIALNGSSLTITIFSDKTGNYNVSTNNNGCTAVYKKTVTSTTNDSYIAISGSVDLTNVDNTAKQITGTYNFTLIHSLTDSTNISITGGKFTGLKYTDTSGL